MNFFKLNLAQFCVFSKNKLAKVLAPLIARYAELVNCGVVFSGKIAKKDIFLQWIEINFSNPSKFHPNSYRQLLHGGQGQFYYGKIIISS